MLWLIVPLVGVAILQDAPPPLVANDARAPGARLHIGDTKIRCIQLPCPSRAVFEPDAQGHAVRDRMLYVDTDGKGAPPPVLANEADRAAIVTAWEERQCLAIDGRAIPGEDDRPILRVDRVVGPCGDADPL